MAGPKYRSGPRSCLEQRRCVGVGLIEGIDRNDSHSDVSLNGNPRKNESRVSGLTIYSHGLGQS